MSTEIDDLANEIARQLELYSGSVKEDLEELTKEASKSALKKLKAESPKDTHDYSKGWRRKKVKGRWVVHNATDWQLTHLLEDGHAKKDGGRVEAQEHIEPVREEVADELEKEIERALQE